MADAKILIDLGMGTGKVQKEAEGLKKTLAGMQKSLSQTVKTLGAGFDSLTASSRALNNTLSNLFGTTKRTLASFDELDRLESKQDGAPTESGTTVSAVIKDVSVQVDASQIVEQIQQTVSSASGPVIDVNFAVDISSVTEKMNDLSLSLETTMDDLLSIDFTPLIGGLLAVMGAAGLLAPVLAGGFGMLIHDLPSVDFSPLVNGILAVMSVAEPLAALFAGKAGAVFGELPSTDFSKLIESISELTGLSIPPLIVGIAAVLFAITTTFGDGAKLIEDAELTLQGFRDFFTGIFTGDIGQAMTGIGEIFDGLRGVVGNVLDAVKNMLFSFLDWLDEKTGGKFSGIIQFVQTLIGGSIDWLRERFMGLMDAMQEIFEGVITFLSGVFSGDWDKALEGVKGIFRGFVNGLIGLVESFVNFFVRGINAVIGAANKLSFKAPDWLGGGTFGINIPKVPELKLPRLAAGAVIPPNREFMAVLGDQRSGNNIETPEKLLRQIFREESGSSAVVSELREILAAVREGKIMMVDSRVLGRVAQDAMASAARAGGLSAVPVR